MDRVNCRNCKYFFVTWDKNFPYGCQKLNFKSKLLPSLEVFQASGKKCLYFEKKEDNND